MKAAPPGEPSTRISAASHHATHATCRRVSGLSCALPASDRFFLSLWMPPPPSPSRLREQRAKACGGSVEEGAHHGSVLSPRVRLGKTESHPRKLVRTRWFTRGVVSQSERKGLEAWRHLCRRGVGASFGVRVGGMTAAGRLLSGTAERCSRLLAHAARASAASNSAHGHKTVCDEKKPVCQKNKTGKF